MVVVRVTPTSWSPNPRPRGANDIPGPLTVKGWVSEGKGRGEVPSEQTEEITLNLKSEGVLGTPSGQ